MDTMSALQRILENQILIIDELRREAAQRDDAGKALRLRGAMYETEDLLRPVQQG